MYKYVVGWCNVPMKKLLFFFLTAILLAACGDGSSSQGDKQTLVEKNAIPFEIVKYEEKIAPIYMNQVPYIAYAETEPQFELLKQRFQIEGELNVDLNEKFVVFVVSQSNSCGIVTDGVYNVKNKLSVQLIEPTGDHCEPEPLDHTFVITVDKADYEKVQLFNGNVIKSSMDVKPVEE